MTDKILTEQCIQHFTEKLWKSSLNTFGLNGGGVKLWENNNSGSFIGQTISNLPDMSQYNYIVFGYVDDNAGGKAMRYEKVKYESNASFNITIVPQDTSVQYRVSRSIKILSPTSIQFLDAFNNQSVDNIYIVPKVIYGCYDLGYTAPEESVISIWVNPNRNTAFNAQTITNLIDLTQFKYIVVGFISYASTNNNDFNPIYIKTKCTIGGYFNLIDGNGNSSESKLKFRQVNIASATSISFNNGFIGTTQDNQQCVPLEIYGCNDLGIFNTVDRLSAYPVGSIYLSINSNNPASLFGGSWIRIKDKFLLASGDTYTNGVTGGEATHTLTVNEIPSHNHNNTGTASHRIGVATGWGPENTTVNFALHYDRVNDVAYDAGAFDSNVYTGGGSAHNNMPPYLAVYMWYRVS